MRSGYKCFLRICFNFFGICVPYGQPMYARILLCLYKRCDPERTMELLTDVRVEDEPMPYREEMCHEGLSGKFDAHFLLGDGNKFSSS